MATLNVNVKQAGANRQFVLVKAYNREGALAGSATTDASGNVAITLTASAYYQIFLEDTHSIQYVPQWVGQNGAGVFHQSQAGTFDVSTTATVNVLMSSDQQLFGTLLPVDAIHYWFWKDTTAGVVIRLMPGEERRAQSKDRFDPLYRHVLAGPFKTYEDASAI